MKLSEKITQVEVIKQEGRVFNLWVPELIACV
jgi:hypothetical protein